MPPGVENPRQICLVAMGRWEEEEHDRVRGLPLADALAMTFLTSSHFSRASLFFHFLSESCGQSKSGAE